MNRARAVAGRAERHEKALEVLATSPELLDGMAEAFRKAGPAFPMTAGGFASILEASPTS